jgi:hypothetical protein
MNAMHVSATLTAMIAMHPSALTEFRYNECDARFRYIDCDDCDAYFRKRLHDCDVEFRYVASALTFRY